MRRLRLILERSVCRKAIKNWNSLRGGMWAMGISGVCVKKQRGLFFSSSLAFHQIISSVR
jgi:hypothetical protein